MLAKSPKKEVPRLRAKPKGLKIPYSVLARSKVNPKTIQELFTPNFKQLFPSNVGPQDKIAMDQAAEEFSALGASLGWAQNAIGSVFAEGLTFLGYAFLAQLAQRPEYRNAAEIIATEMTRKWIKIQSTGGDVSKTEQIKQLNDELDRLQVKDRFRKACETNEYFGRSHIYLDFGTTDYPDELKTPIGNGRNDLSMQKIKKGSLVALKNVEPVWCYPTNYDSINPLKGNWYEPDTWYVMAQQIHASRLLKFVGHEVPDLLKPAYSFGGLSLSQMGKPYVDNWLRTRQSVADLIHAFSVFVLKANLSASLQDGGEEFFRRLEVFINCRDNRGVMAVDKDTEDLENVSAPLGSLDALQAQTQEHMCSGWRIPTIKYLNIQPAGFNASSEGEIRTFYDSINAYQELLFRPNLTKIIDFVQLSLWGEVDPEITFAFEPLWSLDEAALSTKRKTEADTDVTLIDAGIISQEEARKRVASDPTSPYSSIDPEEMPVPPQEEGGMGSEGEMEPGMEGSEFEDEHNPNSEPELPSEEPSKPVRAFDSKEAGKTILPFDPLAHISDEAWDEFVESKHPRVKGGENAGQFAPKGGAGGKGSKKKIASELFAKGVSAEELNKAMGWAKPISPSTIAYNLGVKLEKYKENGITKYKAVQPKKEEPQAEQPKVEPKPPEPKKEGPQNPDVVKSVHEHAPEFLSAYSKLTSKIDTLDHAKDVVKAAVQNGAPPVDVVESMLTSNEKQLLNKHYGSVLATYQKANNYYKQEKQKKKEQEEQQAKYEQAQKEKAEAEAKEMADYSEQDKEAAFALANILGGSAKSLLGNHPKYEGVPKAGYKAIQKYTGSYYNAINPALRKDKLSPEQAHFVKAANEAMAKMPKFTGTTLRGTQLTPEQLAQYEPGMVVREKAFASTSPTKPWSGNTLFTIKSKNGVDVDHFSENQGEKEVLFPAGSWFKVTKKSSGGVSAPNGKYYDHHIEMEEF